MLTRTATIGVVTAVVLVAAPAVAWADGWGEVNCGQAPTPHCQLEVGSEPSGAPDEQRAGQQADDGGGEGENLPSCDYTPSGFQAPSGAGGLAWRPPGFWYEGRCSLTGVIRNPVLMPQLSPVEVARLARAQLGLPKPVVAANPAGTQLVNLPTWLWLTNGWETVAASASVPGVTATATARPRLVTWMTGDGAFVTCVGPGRAFRAGGDPRAPSPDCGHTYRRSSATQPSGTFLAEATVHWSVSWSGTGGSGTFPDMTTTSSTAFRVAESQALNTRPGPR